MKVGVKAHFDSMHRLPGHEKCDVPHGHTYTVEVTVEGPLRDGMVMDFGVLKQAVNGVADELDHRDLNALLDFPSCENLCLLLHARLRERLPEGKLAVRLWEGRGKWAEHED